MSELISETGVNISESERGFSARLGPLQKAVGEALAELDGRRIVERIWDHDHSVWKDDPAEISNRLGWLHSPEAMAGSIAGVSAFVDEVRSDGYTHALLLGMGGSSLAPETFRYTFGVREGYLDLAVLDSTDPGQVLAQQRRLDPKKTLYIVSTKSGGTVETSSLMKYFYNLLADTLGKGEAGRHFAAVTDPGSGLESTARELGFRKVFLNDPDIGGRYSALSLFGLVPAGLIGVDMRLILERAARMADSTGGCRSLVSRDNPGAWLGSVIGSAATGGRDKLTLITSPSITHFGPWVEQLVAESTGKEGRGILPVDGEPLEDPGSYSQDRLFVYIRLKGEAGFDKGVKALEAAGHPVVRIDMDDLCDLGGEFFRWEMATAMAGMLLSINPFDQPNVESAKVLARKMIDDYRVKGRLPELTPSLEEGGIRVYSSIKSDGLAGAVRGFLSLADKGENESVGRSYIALQAYVNPTDQVRDALLALRSRIRGTCRMATTLGYGPRFLHSTGQLHKGDAGHGLFIQLTEEMPEDAPIPDRIGEKGSIVSFGLLKTAQAMGDRQALLDAGRRVLTLHLGRDPVDSLKRIIEIIQ